MNTAYSHQRKWPCRGHLDLTVARFNRVTSCGHRGRKSRLPFATGRHTAGRRIDVANELEHAARRVRRLTASSRGIAEPARARGYSLTAHLNWASAYQLALPAYQQQADRARLAKRRRRGALCWLNELPTLTANSTLLERWMHRRHTE